MTKEPIFFFDKNIKKQKLEHHEGNQEFKHSGSYIFEAIIYSLAGDDPTLTLLKITGAGLCRFEESLCQSWST